MSDILRRIEAVKHQEVAAARQRVSAAELRAQAEAIEKMVRPPLLADMNLKNQPSSILPGRVTYVPDIAKGIKSIYDINMDINHMSQLIEKIEARVQKWFFNDLFQMMENLEGVQPRNEMEIAERRGEKLQVLGPVVEGVENELADANAVQELELIQERLDLQTELAAMTSKVDPSSIEADFTRVAQAYSKRRGISYAWEREIATCLPEYYKFNQWIFLKMYERGLAYRRRSTVNWCPVDNTVLANEQVIDGACWRCGTQVTQKDLEQWFLKITHYADDLLQAAEGLSKWPEKVLTMQRNWIGRSEGARVKFPIQGTDDSIEVFTTRIDTIHGATFDERFLLTQTHRLLDRCLDDARVDAHAAATDGALAHLQLLAVGIGRAAQ